MLETIEARGQVFALVIRCGHRSQGVEFYSRPEYALQLGLLQHPKDAEIKPHIHHSATRSISEVQEVLHIERGRIEAEFFTSSGEPVASCLLNEGDTILLVSGGHGFRVLDEATILEIKQGPYEGRDTDKEPLKVKNGG
ncbi:MAG: hypothetical protein HY671_06085 [Chloroflexi bacterium]|nr:hypothetical protein [Chloroflexota bacterium]